MSSKAETWVTWASRLASGLTLFMVIYIVSSIAEIDLRLTRIETLAQMNLGDHDRIVRVESTVTDHERRLTKLEK